MSKVSTPTAVVVGALVAAARNRIGMSQLDLAHKIGLSGEDAGAAISRLESGVQEPRLDKLIRISNALKVPLESLLPD